MTLDALRAALLLLGMKKAPIDIYDARVSDLDIAHLSAYFPPDCERCGAAAGWLFVAPEDFICSGCSSPKELLFAVHRSANGGRIGWYV